MSITVGPIPHKWAEVIKAWADGQEIQWKHPANYSWTDSVSYNDIGVLANPENELEWRIKPATKTGWINIYSDNESGVISVDKEAADNARDNTRNCVACIQITYTEGEGLTP